MSDFRHWAMRAALGVLALHLLVPPVASTSRQVQAGQRQGENPTGATVDDLVALVGSRGAIGSKAIGHAEGNLTATGEPTSLYWGHTDPGNASHNVGFCSANFRYHRSKMDYNGDGRISAAEGDRRCLETLGTHARKVAPLVVSQGLPAAEARRAFVACLDLANQSPAAGYRCPDRYRAGRERGYEGETLRVWARVESFRKNGHLDAAGLFRACRAAPSRRNLSPWDCVAADQRRRERAIDNVWESES